MGGLVERQIAEAATALHNANKDCAGRCIDMDALVDTMQSTIERKAINVIACYQPVALDLREVIAVLRIANELERIGDLAKNIGKRLGAIGRMRVPRQSLGGIRSMNKLILAQVRDALDSIASRDDTKAVNLWLRDQDVDSLYTSVFRELLTDMMRDPAMITPGVHLVFCAKNMERMADHATNIAEAVYYMVRGETLWQGRPKADETTIFSSKPLDIGAEPAPPEYDPELD
jgi:phosphate transport system protein